MPVNPQLLALLQAIPNTTDPFLIFLCVSRYVPLQLTNIVGPQEGLVLETPSEARRSHRERIIIHSSVSVELVDMDLVGRMYQ